MKKSELRKIIKEEYQNIMREDEGSKSTTQLKDTMLNDVTLNYHALKDMDSWTESVTRFISSQA